MEDVLASQYADPLRDRLNRWAREVDFPEGRIVATRHQGDVKGIKLRVPDLDCVLCDEFARPSPGVGVFQASRMLRAALQETLPPCIVPFGSVKIRFFEGALHEVWFAEKYRIETEFGAVVRYIEDSLRRARSGHGLRQPRVRR